VSRELAAPGHDDVSFAVRNVTFVNAGVKLVKCVVDNISVDIASNVVRSCMEWSAPARHCDARVQLVNQRR
jgi:hypothetical protein